MPDVGEEHEQRPGLDLHLPRRGGFKVTSTTRDIDDLIFRELAAAIPREVVHVRMDRRRIGRAGGKRRTSRPGHIEPPRNVSRTNGNISEKVAAAFSHKKRWIGSTRVERENAVFS